MPNISHINRVLPLKEVVAVTSLSATTIYRKIKEGTFPKQVRLSHQSVGWLESEVNDWIEARIAERDNFPSAA